MMLQRGFRVFLSNWDYLGTFNVLNKSELTLIELSLNSIVAQVT